MSQLEDWDEFDEDGYLRFWHGGIDAMTWTDEEVPEDEIDERI